MKVTENEKKKQLSKTKNYRIVIKSDEFKNNKIWTSDNHSAEKGDQRKKMKHRLWRRAKQKWFELRDSCFSAWSKKAFI